MTSEQTADLNSHSNTHRHRGLFFGLLAIVLVATGAYLLVRLNSNLLGRQIPNGSEEQIVSQPSGNDSEIVSRLKNSSEIRVKLTAVKQIVTVKGRYRISSLDGQNTELVSGSSLDSVNISPSKDGIGIAIGERHFPTERKAVELTSDDDFVSVGSRKYRGRLRIYLNNAGGISLINVLPLEAYLASVVDSEMPASFPVEARKAQAVVSRTYALVHARDHRHRPYDVTDSTRHQRYLGFHYKDRNGRLLAGETAAGRAVASATAGLVCRYEGNLFYTYFSADSGGETNRYAELLPATDLPVFSVVKDPFSEVNPNHRWQTEIPVSSISENELIAKNWLSLRKFGVHSPRFKVDRVGNIFRIKGLGHGHGVGFSQWGANGRAKNGASFDEILRAYFPGAEVTKLAESGQKPTQ